MRQPTSLDFCNLYPPLPTILCLHGGGTSAAIFEAQTRNIRAALGQHYRFVFIDAPHESAPGPGVLPTFADSGPYYSWFSEAAVVKDPATAAAELSGLIKYVEAGLSQQGVKASEVAAVMGFSQGTIVASVLLLQAQWRNGRWARLQFGILLSGACREDLVAGFTGQKLKVPTIHVHGLQDPYLESSRMLAQEVYCPDWASVLEFDGGHHVPSGKSDLQRLISSIKELGWRTGRKRSYS